MPQRRHELVQRSAERRSALQGSETIRSRRTPQFFGYAGGETSKPSFEKALDRAALTSLDTLLYALLDALLNKFPTGASFFNGGEILDHGVNVLSVALLEALHQELHEEGREATLVLFVEVCDNSPSQSGRWVKI